MTTGALIIQSQKLVDPVLLYGLDPFRNRNSDLKVKTIVVDSSDAAAAGTPHAVHRPETTVMVETDLPLRRKTPERLGIGLLKAWISGVDRVFIVSDRVVLPNTFAQFYDEAFSTCERHYTSPSGWLNPLYDEKVFSPGFPAHLREGWTFGFKSTTDNVNVVAHMGLTRGNPEISQLQPEKKIDKPSIRTVSFWPSGWFPISYTNFGARRDVIPALLPVALGVDASPALAGLLLQALAKRKGEAVTLGRPIVMRLEDAADWPFREMNELMVIETFTMMLDRLVPQLRVGSYLDMMIQFSKLLTLRELGPWESLFTFWPPMMETWLKRLQETDQKAAPS